MPLLWILGSFVTGATAYDTAISWWDGEADENEELGADGEPLSRFTLTWKKTIVISLGLITFWKLLPMIKGWIK